MQDRAAIAKECVVAPPANATVYARTLHRACLVLGGADRLAEHLRVPSAKLMLWLQGEEKPDEQAFIACVEIVLLQAEGPAPAN